MFMIHYSEKGIPINIPIDESFYITKYNNSNGVSSCTFKGDSIFYEIDDICVGLYDTVLKCIFDEVLYYQYSPLEPLWYRQSGIDSESVISKTFYEQYVQEALNGNFNLDGISQTMDLILQKLKPVSRYIYLYDLHALIGYVQNSVISIMQNVKDFYTMLAEYEDMNIDVWRKEIENDLSRFDEKYYFASGGECVKIFNSLSGIVISLCSTFDLLSKLTYEVEHLPQNFGNKLEKFKCNNIIFTYERNNRVFGTMDITDTIFETNKNIKLISDLRNELIHNSSWQNVNKIYFHYNQNKLIEKFILIPDFDSEGNIVRSGNRNHFFSQENKINELLPKILDDIMLRIYNTLRKIKSIAESKEIKQK